MVQSRPSDFTKSIFRVISNEGLTEGTAFAVADGIVVTCTHVVDSAMSPTSGRCTLVHHLTGREYSATVLSRCSRPAPAEDISTLRIAKSKSYAPVQFGEFNLQSGQWLHSFGYPEPKSVEGLSGRAIVVGPTTEAGHPVWTVESDQFTVGFSGAPAVDTQTGLAVGMVVSVSEVDALGRLSKTAFVIYATTILSVCKFATAQVHPRLESYANAILRQLDKSPYFLPGLPSFSLRKTFQAPAVQKIRKDFLFGTIRETVPLHYLEAAICEGLTSICIIGDAGCGKSTLLRYFAMSLLERRSKGRTLVPIYLRAKHLAAGGGLTLSEKIISCLRRENLCSFDFGLEDDFLQVWEDMFNASFVVLVDACDEIADLRQRVLFLRYVREELSPLLRARGHKLVLSSRDIGQLEAIKEEFDVFGVESLPAGAPMNIGKAIVGARAADFPAFVERLSNRQLLQSPLSLLLLLTIYLNHKDWRSNRDWDVQSIYTCYFELAKDELQQRGITSAVADDVASLSIEFLQIIAWRDITGAFDEDSLLGELSEFVGEQTKRGRFSSEKEAVKLYNFLAEGAGFFSNSEGNLDWVHQNFRDYLAAKAFCSGLAKTPRPSACLLIEDSWDDASQETFARLLLCMTAEEHEVGLLVSRLLAQRTAFVPFLSRASADGARFSSDFESELAERLFQDASAAFGTCLNLFASSLEDPVAALKLVVWKEPFLSRAIDFLSGVLILDKIAKPQEFRIAIANDLGRMLGGDQMRILLQNPNICAEARCALQSSI